MSPVCQITHGESMLKVRHKLATEEEENRKKKQRKVERERKKAVKLTKGPVKTSIYKTPRSGKQNMAQA